MKPYIVVEWNDTETDAKGWLCVFNFVKGYTGGGTRMHPTVTKEEVIRLATAMGYKYHASTQSQASGGCKAGIAYDYKAPDAPAVLKRFLIAVMPYIKYGVFLGADLGTNYNFILNVFREHGVLIPQAKWMIDSPLIQKGQKDYDDALSTTIDRFELNDAVTGYGVAFCADEAWKFKGNKAAGTKVVIQGFGCVGASCAYKMEQLGYKIVGISDANLLVECQDGLDVNMLIDSRKKFGEMDKDAFKEEYKVRKNTEWLDVDCDILIPAALEDVINITNVDKVKATLIVEGANIPVTAEADAVLFAKGVDVVNDFIANLGAIRFCDAVVFGMVKPEPQAVMDDIEVLCRENTRKLFAEAKRCGEHQRDVAKRVFEPTVQDYPGLENLFM